MRPRLLVPFLVIAASLPTGAAPSAEPAPSSRRGRVVAALRQALLPARSVSTTKLPDETVNTSVYLADEDNESRTRLVALARRYHEEGAWRSAIDAYQRVIDEFPHGLHRLTARNYVSASDYCHRQLASFPPEALRLYRSLYDPKVESLYAAARAKDDWASLTKIADSFACTSFGDNALDYLATVHLERGQYGSALERWRQLVAYSPDTDVELPLLLVKLAICCRKVGQSRAAEAILEVLRAECGGSALRLGGAARQVGLTLLDELRAVSDDGPARRESGWWTLGGDNRHAQAMATAVEPGPLRWSEEVASPLTQLPATRTSNTAILRRYQESRLPYHLVADDGIVYYRTTDTMFARFIRTGKLKWERRVPGTANRTGLTRWKQISRYADLRHVYTAALGGDCVFTNLLTHFQGTGALQHNLMALSKADGTVLWTRGGTSDQDDFLKGVTFSSPPIERAGSLFAEVQTLAGGSECYLACFDASDGSLRWKQFLCMGQSRSAVGWVRAPLGANATVPAEAAGSVFHCTNAGAVAALDAESGQIRWIAKYDAPVQSTRNPWARSRQVGSSWANNPLMVAGDKLVAAPLDADYLYAFDVHTGSTIWRWPRGDYMHVLGIVDGQVYVSGRNVACLDLATGQPRWTVPISAGLPHGRGAIAGDVLYYPFTDGIRMLRASSGKPLGGPLLWRDLFPKQRPRVSRTEPGRVEQPVHWNPDQQKSGNLLVMDNKLLVAGNSYLNAFDDNQVARADIAKRLETNPQDPVARFEMGKMQVWEGRHPDAIQSFEQAIQRARPGQTYQGVSLLSDSKREICACHLEVAMAHAREGEPRAALRAYESALRYAVAQDELRLETLVRLAGQCRQMSQLEQAVGYLQQMIREFADFEPTQMVLGEGTAGAYAEAETARIIDKHGRIPYAAQDAKAGGLFARARRNRRDAEYLEILRYYPNSRYVGPTLLALAELAQERKEYASATNYQRELLRRFPDSELVPAALVGMVLCYNARNARSLARVAARRLQEAYPGREVMVDGKRMMVARFVQSTLEKTPGLGAEPAGPAAVSPPLARQWVVPMRENRRYRLLSASAEGSGVLLANANALACHDARDGKLLWQDAKATGILVVDVLPGTPAEKAGLLGGDIILQFQGDDANELEQFIEMVGNTPIGRKASVLAISKGREKRIDVTIGERPPQFRREGLANQGWLGIHISPANRRVTQVERVPAGLLIFRSHEVKLVDPRSGRQVWHTYTGQDSAGLEPPRGVVVDFQVGRRSVRGQHARFTVRSGIICGAWAADRRIFLLDAGAGAPLWDDHVRGLPVGEPLLAGGNVIVPTNDPTQIVALDLLDGTERYRCDTRTQSHRSVAPILVGERKLAAVGPKGVTCYDAGSGRELWSVPTTGRKLSHLVASDKYLCVPDDRKLTLVDVTTGRAIWAKLLSGLLMERVMLGDQHALVFSRTRNRFLLDAYNLHDATIAWRYYWDDVSNSPTAVATARHVVLAHNLMPKPGGQSRAILNILDAITGKLVWTHELPGTNVGSIAITDGTLCVVTKEGVVGFRSPK